MPPPLELWGAPAGGWAGGLSGGPASGALMHRRDEGSPVNAGRLIEGWTASHSFVFLPKKNLGISC